MEIIHQLYIIPLLYPIIPLFRFVSHEARTYFQSEPYNILEWRYMSRYRSTQQRGSLETIVLINSSKAHSALNMLCHTSSTTRWALYFLMHVLCNAIIECFEWSNTMRQRLQACPWNTRQRAYFSMLGKQPLQILNFGNCLQLNLQIDLHTSL